MEILPQLLLVFFLVFLNGFFVASEFALVAVRKTRIESLAQKGNKMAELVRDSLQDIDTVISATQLGITIASLALGWVGEPAIAHFIEPYFSFLPHQVAFFSSHGISVALAFTLITFLHIVIGELAPKTIALEHSEKTSFLVIAPLLIFTTIFKPIIWILNKAGFFVIKLIGIQAANAHQTAHNEEEIRLIVTQSGESGVIPKDEVEMVKNVFRLGDIPVKHVMIPRTEVTAFDMNTPLSTIRKHIEKEAHSRFPIYEHKVDTIIGFIHVKDFYREIIKSKENRKVSDTRIIREIITVPESKRADDVLLDMRKKRIHMAVVLDEYGGTAGIVTLEDIIESLVGEIQDEFDQPVKYIEKQSDGSFLIDGRIYLEEIQKKFKIPLRGQSYTSLGGLVFGLLGREAKKGDHVQIGNITLEVERLEGKRIQTIRLKKNSKVIPAN